MLENSFLFKYFQPDFLCLQQQQQEKAYFIQKISQSGKLFLFFSEAFEMFTYYFIVVKCTELSISLELTTHPILVYPFSKLKILLSTISHYKTYFSLPDKQLILLHGLQHMVVINNMILFSTCLTYSISCVCDQLTK